MTAGAAETELERIYGLPLEEFTEARNEAAKDLKAGGDAKAAAAVKAAPKPTRAAWIVNRLAREERKGVERLLEAGERLRAMQERMVAGRAEPAELREAAAAEQRQIDSLMRAAKSAGGATAQALDRVGETLQAAAGDPELAQTIRAGRLERERRASSLGLLGTAAPAPRAAGRPAGSKGSKGSKGRKAAEKHDDEAERRAKREAAVARRRAERRVASAEKSLERARGLAETAERALAERRERVDQAERELADARAELYEGG